MEGVVITSALSAMHCFERDLLLRHNLLCLAPQESGEPWEVGGGQDGDGFPVTSWDPAKTQWKGSPLIADQCAGIRRPDTVKKMSCSLRPRRD